MTEGTTLQSCIRCGKVLGAGTHYVIEGRPYHSECLYPFEAKPEPEPSTKRLDEAFARAVSV